MSSTAAADADLFAGHSPDQSRPLVGYATLTGVFLGACGAFLVWLRRAGIELPERIDGRDVALVSVATHKLSRLITRDRVTSTVRAPFTRFQDDAGPSEVDEAARGRGLRRAIGELMICPYCLDLWISAGFVGGLVARPRATRSIASVFTVLAAADGLQIAYKKAEDAL